MSMATTFNRLDAAYGPSVTFPSIEIEIRWPSRPIRITMGLSQVRIALKGKSRSPIFTVKFSSISSEMARATFGRLIPARKRWPAMAILKASNSEKFRGCPRSFSDLVGDEPIIRGPAVQRTPGGGGSPQRRAMSCNSTVIPPGRVDCWGVLDLRKTHRGFPCWSAVSARGRQERIRSTCRVLR